MADKDESLSKLQAVTGIITALGSIAIPIVLFVVGNEIAERQRVAADRQIQADRVERMLAHLVSDKSEEKKLSVKVLEFFVSEQQFPRELLPVLVEIASSDAKEDVAATATSVLKQVAQSPEPQVAKAAQNGLSSLPPRINLHPSASDANKAQSALSDLSHSDVVVAQQAPVQDPPPQTELRYYRKEDELQAQQMAQRLLDKGIKAQVTDWSNRVNQQVVRPRSYDLVIGKQ